MATTTINRHPIRGLLYGIVFGLGLMLLAVGQGMAALGTWPPFVLLVVGIVVGTLWGMLGPAKAPKGDPPAERVEVINESSRFDDFGDTAASREPPSVAEPSDDTADEVGDTGAGDDD